MKKVKIMLTIYFGFVKLDRGTYMFVRDKGKIVRLFFPRSEALNRNLTKQAGSCLTKF